MSHKEYSEQTLESLEAECQRVSDIEAELRVLIRKMRESKLKKLEVGQVKSFVRGLNYISKYLAEVRMALDKEMLESSGYGKLL